MVSVCVSNHQVCSNVTFVLDTPEHCVYTYIQREYSQTCTVLYLRWFLGFWVRIRLLVACGGQVYGLDARTAQEKHPPELVTLLDVLGTDVSAMPTFDALILGVPTWNIGEVQPNWEDRLSAFEDLDLQGIPVVAGWSGSSCRCG